jgi:enolase
LKAVYHVNTEIKDHITGKEFADVKELDDLLIALDGTPNKSRLGANALLGVSMAYCVAMSHHTGTPLYRYL